MHRGQVRTRHPALQTAADRLGGQGLDVAAEGIVAFVAVQVHAQAPLRRQFTGRPDRCRAIRHRSFEMRDAADNVDTCIQRADHLPFGALRPVPAVLREGDKLEV